MTIGNALNISGGVAFAGGSYGITFNGPIALTANNPPGIWTSGNVTFAGNIRRPRRYQLELARATTGRAAACSP